MLLIIGFFGLFLSGCDQFSQPQSTQAVGLDSTSATAQSTASSTAVLAPDAQPVEQSEQPEMLSPEPAKIYTFQGNVLLPPNIYLDNTDQGVDNVDICGVLSLNEPKTQKYCHKFSELSNRLYDNEHSGLDVWDVQGNWYLLLTKPGNNNVTEIQELWVDKNQFGVYHPYADIMQQKLLFLGDWTYQVPPTWPLQAYDAPGGNVIELKKENYPAMKSSNPMVAITSVAQSPKKELWFRINLINNLCQQTQNAPVSPVVMNIWYPAYRLENNLRIPTVWYNARGC